MGSYHIKINGTQLGTSYNTLEKAREAALEKIDAGEFASITESMGTGQYKHVETVTHPIVSGLDYSSMKPVPNNTPASTTGLSPGYANSMEENYGGFTGASQPYSTPAPEDSSDAMKKQWIQLQDSLDNSSGQVYNYNPVQTSSDASTETTVNTSTSTSSVVAQPIDTRTQDEKNAAFFQAFSDAQAAAAAGDPTKLRNFDKWFGITRPEAEYGQEFYSGSSLDERINLVNSMNISQDTKSKIILELQSGNTGPTVEMFVDWFGNGNPQSEGATTLGSSTAGKIALTNAINIPQDTKSKIILELQSGNTGPSVNDFVDWFSRGNPQSEGALKLASTPTDIQGSGSLQGTLGGSMNPVATGGAPAVRGATEAVSSIIVQKPVSEMSNAEILDRLDQLGFTMDAENQGSFTNSSYTPAEVKEITEIVGFISASTDQSLDQELKDRFVDFSAGSSTGSSDSTNANVSLEDMSAEEIYSKMKEFGISMDASGNITSINGSFEGVDLESLASSFGNLTQDQKDQLSVLFAREADSIAVPNNEGLDVSLSLSETQTNESADRPSGGSAGELRLDNGKVLGGAGGPVTTSTDTDTVSAIDVRKAAIQSRLDRIAAQRAPYGGSITDPRSDMIPPPIVGGSSNSGLPSHQ